MPKIDLFWRHSVKTMRSGSFSDLIVYYKCDRSEKNKHPAMNESRVLIFSRLESGMVRTKNAPTKQIVAGSPDSHLVEAMGVEPMSEKSSVQVSPGAGDLQHSRRVTPVARLTHW